MSSLTQILLWCPVQVTVLALVALAVGMIAGRRRPAAGALIAAAALISFVGLTALAFSPWPDWSISWDRLAWRQAVVADDTSPEAPSEGPAFNFIARPSKEVRGLEQPIPACSTGLRQPEASLLDHARADVPADWPRLIAVLYLAGVAAMALRIALGLLAVRGYRRHSHPITDRRLGELADVICAQLCCAKGIELRETTRLSTPATIGWLRPMLLLPPDWRNWTENERRAVLAHEIEHVRRHDFASWMAAQLGVALHFYHPLVHWLANRLRLQQELAADAAAARVLGGQRKYVTTLAAMALRQADQPPAWPASAFIPNSKTFLRRIEMLHRSKSLRGDVPRPFVALSVAAVVLAAVCAAGIRGSVAGDQPAPVEGGVQYVTALNQAEAPPAAAPAQDKFAERRKALRDEALVARAINQLKQLALAMHNYHDVYQHFPPAVVIGPDGKTPHSWRVELLPFLEQSQLYNQYRMNEPWDSPHNKQILRQIPDVFQSPFEDPASLDSSYYVLVGPGTVFEGPQGIKIADITDGTSNTLMIVEAKRSIPWTKPEDIPFDPKKPLPELGGFVKGQFLAAMADGSAHTFKTEGIKDQLKWLIMRNDGQVVNLDQPGRAMVLRIRQQPGARGAITRNNLKQILLAMHNYHDIHGHFPPAAVIGPDGKTPHSWRVELLPIMERKALYDQYHLDEPWDSENNKKVLAQIPDIFHSPYDNPNSTNSGYYALVGPGTVFEGPEGIKIADIVDGTSNTIMIVETKRNIPWTKPEDIPFDPDKPLPELGGFVNGGLNCAFADGSTHLLRLDRVKDQLKLLILRNDHQVINYGALNGE
ncbi:MAG TPA: M56 family metallopeptidase [Planctomycetaceae bacterium]|nr:M56 family metallopeptidase [Planctomycetaceae bacterium]